MTVVAFTVHGEPAPQGSKTVGRSKAGAAFVREDNPQTGPWRNAVAAAAAAAFDATGRTSRLGGPGLLTGPLRLEVDFVFGRPKSHYRTGKRAGELKPSAPHYRTSRPDVDKLVRAIGDAITQTLIADDAEIVELVARKVYGSPAAHVAITELAA